MNKLVNDYANELQKKDRELDKMKELLCMYEVVIEDIQRERTTNPYLNRNFGDSGEGFHRQQPNDNKMQLDANVYVSNLLRKISLLEFSLPRWS